MTCHVLEVQYEEELQFSSLPEALVAEQLTYMDSKLFQKVVSQHCLGSIWSRRDRDENKELVLSIRATITQFNAVCNCVVSTIVKNKDLKTHQRARIMERWIHIAHECRALKNFSALGAVVSALQSCAVFWLKSSRARVPKKAVLLLEELAHIFADRNNSLAAKELVAKGTGQVLVPYLGAFLTDLVMLDTALRDCGGNLG
ncbi:ral guanine nucleotide dissociation stimulator-like 1, partial [Pogoniulus pusillus]|uniref:ral guanine nucleotide dissociation stimulator-like 1 n=2 Tax=Pogoniulus pusillus TaxID=488313 RepID=UPI0030B99656